MADEITEVVVNISFEVGKASHGLVTDQINGSGRFGSVTSERRQGHPVTYTVHRTDGSDDPQTAVISAESNLRAVLAEVSVVPVVTQVYARRVTYKKINQTRPALTIAETMQQALGTSQ